MFGSALCMTLMNLFIKLMPDVPSAEIVFLRSIIGVAICTVFLKTQKIDLMPKKHGELIAITILGLGSIILYYITIQRMDFGMALSLRYLSPFFVMILAIFAFNEHVKLMQWLSVLVVIIGLVFLKDFDANTEWTLFIYGILGAVLTAISYILVKRVAQREHPFVIINYGFGLAIFILIPFVFGRWQALTFSQWMLCFGVGITGFVGSILLTYSFKQGDAGKVAPVKYVEVLAAFIIGFFFFGETYNTIGIIGIFLIFTGLLGNIYFQKR